MLDAGKRLQSVATVGQVLQYPYDPYRVDRARGEEFGDVLAEGTFWLLDQGKPASDGDLAHWRDFLAHRKKFIEQVQDMVERTTSIDAKARARMGEALRAALGRCACITPELCVAYMKALATDQERWLAPLQQIRRQPKLSREEAVRSLTAKGRTPLTWYTRTPPRRASPAPGGAHRSQPRCLRGARSGRANFRPRSCRLRRPWCLAGSPLRSRRRHCSRAPESLPHRRRMRWKWRR